MLPPVTRLPAVMRALLMRPEFGRRVNFGELQIEFRSRQCRFRRLHAALASVADFMRVSNVSVEMALFAGRGPRHAYSPAASSARARTAASSGLWRDPRRLDKGVDQS